MDAVATSGEEPEVDQVARVLWPAEPRRRRGPQPKLSLDDVAAAGIAIADTEDVAAVTMRRVADHLGAAKMALYRYVPGKAELLALMADRALGLPPLPGTGTWREQLVTWALTMNERMTARPWVLHLTIGRRTPGPHELAWFEQGIAALKDTPLDGSERLDTLAAVANHVRGTVQQAAGTPDPEAGLADALVTILTERRDQFPETARAFGSAAATGRQDEGLRFGLDLILDGIAALIAERDCGSGLLDAQRSWRRVGELTATTVRPPMTCPGGTP